MMKRWSENIQENRKGRDGNSGSRKEEMEIQENRKEEMEIQEAERKRGNVQEKT